MGGCAVIRSFIKIHHDESRRQERQIVLYCTVLLSFYKSIYNDPTTLLGAYKIWNSHYNSNCVIAHVPYQPCSTREVNASWEEIACFQTVISNPSCHEKPRIFFLMFLLCFFCNILSYSQDSVTACHIRSQNEKWYT